MPQWPGLASFKDFWTRGNGNPDEVLRLIESEGRTEEMRWVVQRMAKLKSKNDGPSATDDRPAHQDAQSAPTSDELQHSLTAALGGNFNNVEIQLSDSSAIRVAKITAGSTSMAEPISIPNASLSTWLRLSATDSTVSEQYTNTVAVVVRAHGGLSNLPTDEMARQTRHYQSP